MATAEQVEAYNRREISRIAGAFKAMDEEATKEAQRIGGALAEFLRGKIIEKAYTVRQSQRVAVQVAQGATVAKTSKVGEISFGFATQRFSGGGTTRQLWPGFEFGSNRFKQFPAYSGRYGRGSRGWFIYPTLRKLQPELIRKWEEKFAEILKEWGK